MKFYARREQWSDSVDLYIVDQEGDHTRRAEVSFSLGEPVLRGSAVFAPSWSMVGRDAQMLLDALWEAGLRPNDGSGSGAQVSALKDHLKDLQRIVFDKEKP